MKLRNKMKDVRALRDLGQLIEVGPGETVDVERPIFNERVFEIVDTKKSKEKTTLNTVEKEQLNKKEGK